MSESMSGLGGQPRLCDMDCGRRYRFAFTVEGAWAYVCRECYIDHPANQIDDDKDRYDGSADG